MTKRLRILFIIFWTVLVFVLLTIPYPQTEDMGVSYFDKIVHAVLFGVFVFLVYYSFGLKKLNKKILRLSIFLGVFYSILGEIIQMYLSYRASSGLDLLAGVIGILVAILFIYEKYQKRKT